MKQPVQISALPLLQCQTVIIECGLVGIETTSTMSKLANLLRCEIKDLSQLPFALPDLFFRPLAFGDVHHGSHELDTPRFVAQGHNMDMLDGPILHHQAMLKIKIFLCLGRVVDGLLYEVFVVGMNSLED